MPITSKNWPAWIQISIGIAIVTADGQVFTKGDLSSRVSIQSISKVFTLAKVIEESGAKAVKDKIGVDATGLRFNSIVAIELQKGKEINPLVNPGAIACVKFDKREQILLQNGKTSCKHIVILQE